jgi:hypothetical protein
MQKRFRELAFTAFFLTLAVQASFAQSSDYLLERVAIHARLVQAKIPVEDPATTGGLFSTDLQALLEDLELWTEKLPAKDRGTYQAVKEKLEKHSTLLRISSRPIQLTPEQATVLELLFLELEQAAEHVDTEYEQQVGVNAKERSTQQQRRPIRLSVGVGPGWNAWGGGPWGGGLWGGGWNGAAWGGGGPWGPFFGQPYSPAFGPRCW